MIDVSVARKMKLEGKTYAEIGRYFGVSRQRAANKLINDEDLRRHYNGKKYVNKWEQKAYDILKKFGVPVEFASFHAVSDLYVLGRPTEVKFRSNKAQFYLNHQSLFLFLLTPGTWSFIPTKILPHHFHFNYKNEEIIKRYCKLTLKQIVYLTAKLGRILT